MNLDSLSLSLSHIGFIFANLNKKNLKQASQELSRIISKHGLETEVCILRHLLTECIKVWDSDSSGSSSSNIYTSLLAQHFPALLNHPARNTVVCQTVSQSVLHKSSKSAAGFIETLSKSLKLSTAEDVAISLILKNSPSTDIIALINQHLKKKFPELIQSYLDSDHIDRSGLQDCSIEVLQLILSNLLSKDLPVAAVTTNLFLKQLRSDFKRDLVPIVLAPLLYPDDTQTPLEEMITNKDMSSTIMDSPLAEMIRELGYSFTSSVEECKNNMLNIMVREPSAMDVAKIISMMIRYHTTNPEDSQLQGPSALWISHQPKKEPSGHNNAWNTEVFVQTLKELVPNLNWKDVILQLDNPDFMVPDKLGLALLFKILRVGLQSAAFAPDIFPVEHLYRHWTNIEGQMSLIIYILKYPEIFSFADYPFNLVSIDILKLPPELNNKEIATWRCVNLVELLLHAGERGYYMQVHELFKFPMQHCPDVLLLALLQINSPITVLRHELLTTLIPIFLENHPNSGTILHLVWQTQNLNIKPIMMHALVDWYIRGDFDQSKLSRILDVAQDLKALSLLLNVQSFPFVIDLACLASRREYLKLDKWLADKIRDLGETFILAIVKFLQRRCPQVIGGKLTEDQLPLAAQLPVETISTMLACLQLCTPNVRPELQEAIYAVVSNCQALIINKTRQNITSILRPPSVIDTPYSMGMGALFPPHPGMDPVANLASNVANMSLGAAASTAFAMHGMSPSATTQRPVSRIGVNSPFGMNPMQHNIKIGTMADMERMAPAPAAVDKPDVLNFKEMMTNVSKEIEDEANSYFQRIYNHPPHPTLSIDEVLLILQKFQESPNKRENDVYACMLRNLFEEYKFFPQYPDKELYTTAQLFGGIIEKSLVPSYVCLGLALRLVLEALHKPPGSKMYNFGVVALDRFKARLKDYQKYCERLRAIQHFNEFPPHLMEYVEFGLQSQEPPSKPQGSVLPPILAKLIPNPASASPYRSVSGSPSPGVPASMAGMASMASIGKVSMAATAPNISTRPSIATATNIDTLLTATDREDNLIVPPENVQDKTAFIFNNLSLLNLQNKCEELKEIIHDEYYPWLAQYLVMNRASIEINFHPLYSSFLEVLKQAALIRLVIRETYRNIKVLLQSDKGIANFSDRSLLKNLGHWLGLMTLARNKPILFNDIDLKSMLLEAYHKGQQDLLYVVPFVAKILESCAKSIVFKPPNPWTMALMNVLAELHQEPDLKLNLKFEIEVLCKSLSLDVSKLKPTVYLRDTRRLKHLDSQLSQPKPSEAEPAQPIQTPVQHIQTPIQPDIVSTPVIPTPGVPEPEILPEPRFSYVDVNITSKTELGSKLSYNPHIILFQKYPQVKQLVIPTIERSIQEWIHPVVDRSIKYALTTCEHIIKKDFSLDPDEIRMRQCAHYMMRNLTAGMAMITCREQVVSTITTNLKSAFLAALLPASSEQKELVESAAAILASENMELSCAFIQKTAVEKALVELDKRLVSEYEMRKLARQEGRRYCDNFVLKYQIERMPERIRLRVGGPDEKQLLVYEEFACNIPGFIPVRESSFLINSAQKQPFTHPLTQVMNLSQTYGADDLSTIIAAAEQFLGNIIGSPGYAVQAANLQSLIDYLITVRRNDVVTACNLMQKCVDGLLEGYVIQSASTSDRIEVLSRYRDIHLRLLKYLEYNPVYGQPWTLRQVAYCLTEAREELRYNLDAVDCLIRNNLVNIHLYDIELAKLIESGNKMAVSFGMRLVHAFLNEIDLSKVAEALLRVSRARPAVDPLAHEGLDAPLGDATALGPTAHIHSGIQHVRSREYNDPPGLKEKTENLMCEWRTALMDPLTELEIAQSFNLYIHRMNMIGVLKSDDMITRFFRIAAQMAIEDVYQLLNDDKNNTIPALPKRENYYRICDSLTKLISLLIKNTSDSGHPTPKLNLLNKILGIIAGCLLRDQEERGTNFQQLPYHRLLLMLFLDMNMADNVSDSINFLVVTSFCHTLHLIRPSLAPGFCYSWLEIISHRLFIDRVLAATPQKGWGMYSTLLLDQLKFLEPFLKNPELPPPVKLLYKGTLKVLLVLLHDFPEFLCDYTHALCDEIPPNCIQMRNLVLSAFPRKMRLPDPFTPNLKVDLLPEIALLPRSAINYATLIHSQQFREELDAYLRDRAPVTFLSDLRSRMQLEGGGYDVRLINAVVQYVGAQALATVRSRCRVPSLATIAHTAHMDIFQNFTVDFDLEGRYHFLNAIGNQLRYPNSYTHYFSCCLLYLFAEANSEAIQEQITRMLLERLIVNRPHPWGLLVTFIELIKNPAYKFWTHDFVHCAPEIEKSQCMSRFKPSVRIVGSSAAV